MGRGEDDEWGEEEEIKEKTRSRKDEKEEMKEEEEKMMRRLRSRALFEDREESWESCTSAGHCWEPVGSGEDEEVGRLGRRGGSGED